MFLACAVVIAVLIEYVAVSDAVQSLDSMRPRAVAGQVRPETLSLQVQLPGDSELITSTVDKHAKEEKDCDGNVTFKISYNGVQVEPDEYVPRTKAASAPTIEIHGGQDQGLFTWIMIDIDAPDPENPSASPFLHYIVANLNEKHPQDYEIIESYYPVTPPIGKHRYVSLLYLQPQAEPKPASQEAFKRPRFDVPQYVDQHQLKYVGRTEFYSQPEEKR